VVFAVATLDSVVLYDTENFYPIALVQGNHYAELTDITWSIDGSMLCISSKDGFCTVVSFAEGELGEKLDVEMKG